MSSFKLWQRRLRPSIVWGRAQRVVERTVRRISRPDLRVATLPATGESRGRALLSYIVDGMLLAPERPLPRGHTHFWESREIARALADLGYDVDVIHWTNDSFVPETRYDVAVDVRLNLERLAPLLDSDCLKVQHIETCHFTFHNPAQERRLESLARRRGRPVAPRKLLEPNRAIDVADVGTTVGNDFTIGTYGFAGKSIRRIPISVPCVYPSPEGRDFEAARRRFLWFGSGGLVHKGLDLVLEAFRELPELELIVCGPVDREPDFEAEYARELYSTPNIRTLGWVDVAGPRLQRLFETSVAIVYPSCSEGGGGGVVTCVHGGLLPIVTHEASVDLEGFGTELPDGTGEELIESIREAATATSHRAAADLRDEAMTAWRYVRRHHTRETFARDCRDAFAKVTDASLPEGRS